MMHYCNGLHVDCLTLRSVSFIRSVCFHPFHPFIHTHSCTQEAGAPNMDRTPHVVGQTEIAAPTPAVLISPSLAVAAPLRLRTVITSLRLLHLQPLPSKM